MGHFHGNFMQQLQGQGAKDAPRRHEGHEEKRREKAADQELKSGASRFVQMVRKRRFNGAQKRPPITR